MAAFPFSGVGLESSWLYLNENASDLMDIDIFNNNNLDLTIMRKSRLEVVCWLFPGDWSGGVCGPATGVGLHQIASAAVDGI